MVLTELTKYLGVGYLQIPRGKQLSVYCVTLQ